MSKKLKIFIEPEFTKYYQHTPLRLVDIGASGGLNKNWQAAKKYLHVYGFEPDKRAFKELENSAPDFATYYNIGLYEKPSTVTLHAARKQKNSSILEPNCAFLSQFPKPERFDVCDKIEFKANCLDNILQADSVKGIDFIKVDTQGSELPVLKGAAGTLSKSVFGLEIEAGVAELYKNQPRFTDIDIFLRQYGFHLFDIRPVYWKRSVGINFGKTKGQLIYVDSLYLRDITGFKEILCEIDDDISRKSKLIRALTICFLYGYCDYAFQILSMVRDIFNKKELDEMTEIIKKNFARKTLPHLPGRKKMINLFYNLWNFFENYDASAWNRGGRGVGNV